MENFIEKVVTTSYSDKNDYYCFIYDGIKNIISMDPIDHLESEQSRDEKRKDLIENKLCLCLHSHLHPMKARKENIPQKTYTII